MQDPFDLLKIPTIVNGAGTITLLSGSRIEPDIAAAMAAAAGTSIDIAEAQGRACEIIAECTGAEAGMVTSGASAALMLGAAACIAGLDPQAMAQLPDTTGLRHEFVVPRSQRNSYDHAVRAAGACLVEVGVADRLVGVGVRDIEPWEIEGAIGAHTAGIFYVARPESRPPLPQVAAIARRTGVPLLVDAAAELPPAANLRRFIEEGADLVAFSGGKAIGGPSASGILCGRRRLIASALLQQLDLDYEFDTWQPPRQIVDKSELMCVPRNGIGRSCKVGKEQIVGLLLALRRFAATDDAVRVAALSTIACGLIAALRAIPRLTTTLVSDPDGRGFPLVQVDFERGIDVPALAAQLRAGQPSVRLDAARATQGTLVIVPTCLGPKDPEQIGHALGKVLQQL
jgi:L-seryl-tRNA(Ser) seleniumtransferase